MVQVFAIKGLPFSLQVATSVMVRDRLAVDRQAWKGSLDGKVERLLRKTKGREERRRLLEMLPEGPGIWRSAEGDEDLARLITEVLIRRVEQEGQPLLPELEPDSLIALEESLMEETLESLLESA